MVKADRIYYLDIARGLAVLLMVMQHCILIHERNGGEGEGLLGNVLLLLGTAPAAPVFMLIMGVFIASNGGGPKSLFRRGAILFLLGYLLNFLRFTLPLGLVVTTGEVLATEESPWHLFWEVDILQLAGLSFLAATALQPLSRKEWVLPVIIVIVALLSPWLWGRMADCPLIVPLWGDSAIVSFPFFPWVIYPLIGMALSPVLLELPANAAYRRRLMVAGVALLVGGILSHEYLVTGDYHRSGAGVHAGITGFVFLWLVLCCRVSESVSNEGRAFRLLVFWSRHVTAIYFIQWILFGWSILFFGANQMNDIAAASVGLVVLLISHLLVKRKGVQNLFAWI